MKDIVIEKNEKKLFANFQDLFTGREEIIKHGSKNIPDVKDETEQIARALHPDKMEVVVQKIVEESPNTKSFYFVREGHENFPSFEAGSYITLQLEMDSRIYKRVYSISSSPRKLNEMRITIKKEGKVSSYMFNKCKENDKFTIFGPFGTFHYNSVRDSSQVVFLAGGSGITSIKPMIEELVIYKKISSVELVYGAKTVSDFLWKNELDELDKKYKNFHVTYLLSEEKRDDYPYGFIDEELIQSLEPKNKSFFISGPIPMYRSLNEIFKKLDIPNKYIRHEIYTNKPEGVGNKEYKLTVRTHDKTLTIPCFSNKTLVQSMEEGHLDPPVHCTVGVCGFCKSKLLSGTVKTENESLRKKDVELKYIHPCVTYPLSDVEIELPF